MALIDHHVPDIFFSKLKINQGIEVTWKKGFKKILVMYKLRRFHHIHV